MTTLSIIILLAIAIGALAYSRARLWLATAVTALLLLGYSLWPTASTPAAAVLWLIFVALAAPLNLPRLRRAVVSDRVRQMFRALMPPMSDTEREALEAGTVWWEAELFGGRPRWRKFLDTPPPHLSEEEKAFLAGPVEELCRMLDDWHITHERLDLPPEAWEFLKKHRFFGMIIPKRYGGLEFSARGHSEVVMKIASRSVMAAVTVMVPNSLGPAELLLHYGTEKQKDHYLPRLARGEEIPCFGLTGPESGSDAANMPDKGIVCRGEFEGRRDVLGIKLTWSKRYITLGPVASVLGLAFKLFDPDHLLGGEEERGITLALIPTNLPGVSIGRRHYPLNIPFQNGPNWGKDVFIPMDYVIGGAERVGQGWRMLMESLAAGRAISLPALSVASGKMACRATGAYARIRKQFRLPIGKFEAVQEALARIAGYTYLMDAARTFTTSAVDQGEKPAVASAIAKYHLTEHMRRVINDAMDVQGGAGICLGPRNLIGRAYQALPISITVEGANLLTRALIIYGQGAIRCHPHVYNAMRAAVDEDAERGARAFDRALFGHLGLILSNVVRAFWIGVTSARFVRVPLSGPAHRFCQHLTRFSASFAVLSDVAMLSLGGALKRREALSGRLADALSYLYLGSAVIKRFEDQGRCAEDVPLMRHAVIHSLYEIECALDGILRNFPNRPLAWLARRIVFPVGRHFETPNDKLVAAAAEALLSPNDARERLTRGVFVPTDLKDHLARIEDALPKVIAAEALERKLGKLEESAALTGDHEAQLAEARRQGLLSEEEAQIVRAAHEARMAVIQVDHFAPDLSSSKEGRQEDDTRIGLAAGRA